MNPLKRKDIVKITAEQLGLPINVVEDIVSFYYKQVSKKLGSAEFTAVNVSNLGIFVIKKKALAKKIDAYDGFVGRLEVEHENDTESSMDKFGLIMEKRHELEKFRGLMTKLDNEVIRKKEVTERKIAFKNQANEN